MPSSNEYLLQFLDESLAPRNINITQDLEGDFYIGVHNRASITPIYALAASVPVGSTAVIYSQITTANTRYRKIVCTGETDGFFKLLINGSVVAMGKTSPSEYNYREDFAGCVLYVPSGSHIILQVKNTGIITSDFEGILYTCI